MYTKGGSKNPCGGESHRRIWVAAIYDKVFIILLLCIIPGQPLAVLHIIHDGGSLSGWRTAIGHVLVLAILFLFCFVFVFFKF